MSMAFIAVRHLSEPTCNVDPATGTAARSAPMSVIQRSRDRSRKRPFRRRRAPRSAPGEPAPASRPIILDVSVLRIIVALKFKET